MKKIISKIKSSLINSGSSIVLVIVALAFIGILAGSLLTAVGYVYRQKLYDYNAKSNFHYLEQAMDEVYAGLGAKTMTNLQTAYEETREQAIKFNISTKSYETKSDDEVNDIFRKEFMKLSADTNFYTIIRESDGGAGAKIYTNASGVTKDEAAYKGSIVYAIRNMITNSSVELDDTDMQMSFQYNDGSISLNIPDPLKNNEDLDKIIVKNVRLTRTADYKRSSANGTFKQTIQTDIEVSKPDFNVSFDINTVDMSTLFNYCIIADSGVDFDRKTNQVLTINGNIYAASDFYNKDYNSYGGSSLAESSFDRTVGSETITYPINNVDGYNYTDPSTNLLYNFGYGKSLAQTDYKFDGNNERSKYSGFYIDGGIVNLLANNVIVPGSISVMNGGSLSVFGLDSEGIVDSNVWADEVVLGGYSPLKTDGTSQGSSASFDGNLYVKDDTQIEAEYASLKLDGAYYGFSNSTANDGRSYIKTVKKFKTTDTANIYQELIPEKNADGSIKRDADGNVLYQKNSEGDYLTENRGHYNSSSILVNGQHASLDLSKTNTIFLAGRSYIELSNIKNGKQPKKDITATSGKTEKDLEYTPDDYYYSESLQDYKTGESISTKSNQLAYYPSKASGSVIEENGHKYFQLATTSKLYSMRLFTKYFKDGKIPLNYQEVNISATKKKTYYYFDFEQAVREHSYDDTYSEFATSKIPDYTTASAADKTTIEKNITKYADILKQRFVKDYFDYFNFCVNKNSSYKLDYMGYETDYDDASNYGHLALSDTQFRNKYCTSGSEYNMKVDTGVLEQLSADYRTSDPNSSTRQDMRAKIDAIVNELQNVTNYSDFVTGQISIPNVELSTSGNSIKINSSGALTKSTYSTITSAMSVKENVELSLIVDNDSVITSNLLGRETVDTNGNVSVSNNTNKTDSSGTINFAKNYNKHYQYNKATLKDLAEGSDEADFVEEMITANGDAGITPINYYMNYDKLTSDLLIKPSDLGFGTDSYQVYVSGKDTGTTDADDNRLVIDGSGMTNNEVTGLVIARGDVYFKNVKKFNGLIMTGGKVYIDSSSTISSINASLLCRNIINELISKASQYDVSKGDEDPDNSEALNAIKVLEVFKAYSSIAASAKGGEYTTSSDTKDITNIDYSDLIRYNNWMKDVE